MHIHGVNPLGDSNATDAVQAEAKREAAAFRKKLEEATAGMPASDEDCVVSINAEQEDKEGQPNQEDRQEKGKEEEEEEDNQEIEDGSHISNWA